MASDKINVSLCPVLAHPNFEIASDEPSYDPDIHLAPTEPEFVVLLDGYRSVPKAPKLDRPISLYWTISITK